MKLLHFADLHLDAPFGWARAERRQNRRTALRRIMDLAEAENVDAVLSAGDLFEQKHFSPDTVEFLRATFAATRRPIFLAPGNHDWYSERSPYAFAQWTPNVHVFREARFTPEPLGEGITLWGAAHRASANTDGFFKGFRVGGDGVHLALAHASERGFLAKQGEGKQPYAPFDAAEIEVSGFQHALLGHFHMPRDADLYTYPGNPDPLEFGETGARGAVVVSVSPDGALARQRVDVSVSQLHDVEQDVSGATHLDDIRDAVTARVRGLTGGVRLTLLGELPPTVPLDRASLDGLGAHLDRFELRLRAVSYAYDFDVIASEQTVRGQFVRDATAEIEDPGRRRSVLVTGLRALEGRDDLDVA